MAARREIERASKGGFDWLTRAVGEAVLAADPAEHGYVRGYWAGEVSGILYMLWHLGLVPSSVCNMDEARTAWGAVRFVAWLAGAV